VSFNQISHGHIAHSLVLFCSWEFGRSKFPDPALRETDFESPYLVSVIIMRDPISRALAGDGRINKLYPGLQEGNITIDQWWNFSKIERETNNFALTRLAGPTCCSHSDRQCCDGVSKPKYLNDAKDLLKRFTFVLDIACLAEGIQALADILGIEIIPEPKGSVHEHQPIEQRIPYPEVLDYLRERNRFDIKLYEWSKTISLVDCSAIT
jgi:hypothetical protein